MSNIDYFISYTGKDEKWATWIAETLERNGYTTIIQAWDFKAGGSFIEDMHNALKTCKKVILVLSKDYLESEYCRSEWQNVFTDDPIGKKASIIPVRIDSVKPDGLLKARTYIDLLNLDEGAATVKLLSLISDNPVERKSAGFPTSKEPIVIEAEREKQSYSDPANNKELSREELRSKILPMFLENQAIFNTYGPTNTNRANWYSEYSHIWEQKIHEKILPNSIWVITLIRKHMNLLTQNELEILLKYEIHIDGMNKNHTNNSKFLLDAPQFPAEILEILK